MSWLEQDTRFPKVFWKARGSLKCIGAVGDSGTGPTFIAGETVSFKPDRIREVQLSCPPSQLSPLTITESCTPDEWETQVTTILKRIEQGLLQKVVLGRSTTLTFKEPVNPWPLVHQLSLMPQRATVFCIQFSPDYAFLGATPEMLYTREERRLYSEALAGTRPLGTPRKELLEDPKELHEFSLVKEFIQSTLTPISSTVKWNDQESIIETPKTIHLYNQVEAHLKKGVTDKQILKRLHPTPAMGGVPRDEALKTIEELESFDRGLFAAPLGWISEERTEIAIGIRSALLKEKEMQIFAAAGIVRGSHSKKEWSELTTKMSLMRGLA